MVGVSTTICSALVKTVTNAKVAGFTSATSVGLPRRIGLPAAVEIDQGEAGSPFGGTTGHDKSRVVTPISVDRLAWWLDGYDESLKNYLLTGFLTGFRIGFSGTPISKVFKNHNSALQHPEVIEHYIQKEIRAGRIFGPLESLPKEFHCAPLGLVPKKQENEYRVIHDLSYPPGQSVNDHIPPEHTAVSYDSVYDAIYMLASIGDGSFMSKTDIQKAFRIIPINPEDQHLFCFEWDNKWYMDLAMQMGCSSSCQIFQTFSYAIKWIAENKLQIHNVSYLDDFLLGSESKTSGQKDLDRFIEMCTDIGIPISKEKTFSPSKVMTFLGIEIDTEKRQVRLPLDKVQQCVEEIKSLVQSKKTRLRKLQSVIGLLNFACQVVLPGRAFLRRLIDLTRGIRAPHHFISIKHAIDDLNIWLEFLEHHNGRIFFVDESFITNHDVHLYTDAAGKLGYGAVFGNEWFFGTWSEWWIEQHIMIKELYPIVIALEIWGKQFCNKRLTLFTDNMSLVPVLAKHTSRDKIVMILVRRLVLTCLTNNILLDAYHIPSGKNTLSDCLSRLQVEKFQKLHPNANRYPVKTPDLPSSLS